MLLRGLWDRTIPRRAGTCQVTEALPKPTPMLPEKNSASTAQRDQLIAITVRIGADID